MSEKYGHIPDGFLLNPQEVEELRKSKKELTEYGKQKLKEMMTKPLQARVSTEDYNKVVNAMNKHTPNYIPDDDALEEMLHLKLTEEKKEELERMRRRETVLRRYNHYYNLETSALPHGTPITPEQQQMIALQSMIDALRNEHLNQEYNAIEITDIEDLIEGLYQQSIAFLERVRTVQEQAQGHSKTDLDAL